MPKPDLRLLPRPAACPVGTPSPRRRADRVPLGAILCARGALDPGDLARALALQQRQDVPLGEILVAHRMVSQAELYAALADQWQARLVDLARLPPDPRLVDLLGPAQCLALRVLPWRRIGGASVIVTSRPAEFVRHRPELEARFGQVIMALAPERDLLEALVALRSDVLVQRAETRVPARDSSRVWNGARFRRRALAALALLAAALLAAPVATFAALTSVAMLASLANIAVRGGAVWHLRVGRREGLRETGPPPAIARLPVVSVLVPLYRERSIVGRLTGRLSALSYPRELLDIVLVTEDDDATTRATLAQGGLPPWMRVVTVPAGTLRTKPRALNYALEFCRGSIVGVYDAEDAPAPDQIHRVVERFHRRGPEVACVQGILSFYDARKNWMARCFALEYAAWFRVVLPGLERMGLVMPLGGTTLFFRRAALERMGGWDAHNVTEDADLGLRLARHGYRTEMIDSVTEEEANARPWPWVRQRSRWLKGYAMTGSVHLRDPARLWRDLGAWRFCGVQVLFGGTLLQAVLAPVLWSYWMLPLGLPHPMAGSVPKGAALALGALFACAWAMNIAVMLAGTRAPGLRHLRPWVLTMGPYFALASVAMLKGLAEMVARPFWWDKTAHGEEPGDEGVATPPAFAMAPLRARVAPAHADARMP
jgi:glycosyltransferase XagB